MKITTYILTTIILGIINTTVIAKSFNNFKPFFGIEISQQTRKMSTMLKENENITIILPEKKAFFNSIFVGAKFNDNIGFEVGYEKQNTIKYLNTYLDEDDGLFLMDQIIKSNHNYFGITYENNLKNKTNWQIFLGASISKIKISSVTTDPQGDNDICEISYCNKTALIPMLRISIIQKITDNFAIKASLKYRTSFKASFSSLDLDVRRIPSYYSASIKYKASYSMGLGVVCSL